MKKRDLYYERIPTKLLREDIKLLGTILGNVIRDNEGIIFFKKVENLRILSKASLYDKNRGKIFSKISHEIKKLPPEQIFKLTRGFAHILNLMNLAESFDASRKLNDYENFPENNKNQNLFIEDIIDNLFRKKNLSENEIFENINNLDIGIVLTAHPTEVKRRTLIQKYAKLIDLLEQRQLFKKYPTKIQEIEEKLYNEISIIWKTDDIRNLFEGANEIDVASKVYNFSFHLAQELIFDKIPVGSYQRALNAGTKEAQQNYLSYLNDEFSIKPREAVEVNEQNRTLN